MRIRAAIAAFALLLIVMTACAPKAPGPPRIVVPPVGASESATEAARATLQRMFVAWSSKDTSATEACLADDRGGLSWGFRGLDRVEVTTITPAPEAVSNYMSNGLGSVSGVKRSDVRAFRATITYYFKPGATGSVESGQPNDWTWFLERRPDGEWRVTDWGY